MNGPLKHGRRPRTCIVCGDAAPAGNDYCADCDPLPLPRDRMDWLDIVFIAVVLAAVVRIVVWGIPSWPVR